MGMGVFVDHDCQPGEWDQGSRRSPHGRIFELSGVYKILLDVVGLSAPVGGRSEPASGL